MSAFARTMRTPTENRSERASRPSRATDRVRKARFSSLQASKWSPRAPWSALGGLLGRFWDPHGRSWTDVGSLLGALGTLSGRFWAALGLLLRAPERSWALLDPPRTILGRFGAIFARFGHNFDPPRRSTMYEKRSTVGKNRGAHCIDRQSNDRGVERQCAIPSSLLECS